MASELPPPPPLSPHAATDTANSTLTKNMLNRFMVSLTSSSIAGMAKCTLRTFLSELNKLIERILDKGEMRCKLMGTDSLSYKINWFTLASRTVTALHLKWIFQVRFGYNLTAA